MPDFAYIARDLRGQRVTGKVAAQTEREVLALLDQKSLFPVEVKQDSQTAAALGQSVFGQRVGAQALATLFGQMADLLRSGVPLLRTLNVLLQQSSSPRLKEVLTHVRADVEEGKPLAEAMARFPTVFNEMSVSIVRAGAEGGFLEDALDQVGTFTEKQQELKSRTIGALAYPAVLATVGTGLVIVLLVYFVPKFDVLFDRLRARGQLPAITEWLLATSAFLQAWGLAMLAAFAGSVWAWTRWVKTPAGRLFQDRVKIKLPLVGKILLSLAVARFCRVLGTMLKNGVPLLKSLEVSASATANRVLEGAIHRAGENVSAGQSLSKPLGEGGHFPPAVLEMIAVAEESNSLDKVLTEVADGLDRRTWRQLDLAVRLLEPLLLVLLAGAVLVVAIALLLPILKMSSTFQK